jgi:hypothetical protein
MTTTSRLTVRTHNERKLKESSYLEPKISHSFVFNFPLISLNSFNFSFVNFIAQLIVSGKKLYKSPTSRYKPYSFSSAAGEPLFSPVIQ